MTATITQTPAAPRDWEPVDPRDWEPVGPEPEPESEPAPGGSSGDDGPPRPVVWAALPPDEAEFEWLALNEWVDDLRRAFNIPATVIPPFWHRHQVLVEHLSALRTHWLAAYDPDQHGSAPFGWIRDLEDWKTRMREAVSQLGCRPDSCRPETPTRWPGEPDPDPAGQPPPANLADRYDDFVTLVLWDVRRRRDEEDHYLRLAADSADLDRAGR
ncbi:MAG: hypothetical protein LBH76_10835 [Propionibacteriaceae bacterium]|jgi:hypothetical protein|nr:hypothetical protein [Propionibacteriaceae bacterium]